MAKDRQLTGIARWLHTHRQAVVWSTVIAAGLTAATIAWVAYSPSRIADRTLNRLKTSDESEIPRLMADLRRLGDTGVRATVEALKIDRPSVAEAARRSLREEMTRWRHLEPYEATRRIDVLSRALHDQLDALPTAQKEFASTLATDILLWPLQGDTEERLAIVKRSESILQRALDARRAQLNELEREAQYDQLIASLNEAGRNGESNSEPNPFEPNAAQMLESTDSLANSGVTSADENANPNGTGIDPSILIPPPLDLDPIVGSSATPPVLNASTDIGSANSSIAQNQGDQTPLQPLPGGSGALAVPNGIAEGSPSNNGDGLQNLPDPRQGQPDGNALQIPHDSVAMIPSYSDPGNSSLPNGSPIEPPPSSTADAQPPSEPSSLGVTNQLYELRRRSHIDLMINLHSADSTVAQFSESELRNRGFTPAQIDISRLVTHLDPDVRLHALDQLSRGASFEPRPWIRWLCNDPVLEIRARAIAVLSSSTDREDRELIEELLRMDANAEIADHFRWR